MLKRIILILITILAGIVFITVFYSRSLVSFMLKKQLYNIFPQAEVSLKVSALNLNQLRVSDIDIHKNNVYSINIKEFLVAYNIRSLLKENSWEVLLDKPEIKISTPQKSLASFANNLNLPNPSGKSMIKSVNINQGVVNLNSVEINTFIDFSANLDLVDKVITELDLKTSLIKTLGVELKNLFLHLNSSQGKITIGQLNYSKIRSKDITANVALNKDELRISDIKARLFNGDITLNVEIDLKNPFSYKTNLTAKGIDIETLVKDLDLDKKFVMTGKLTGKLSLEGVGPNLKILGGEFSTVEFGGGQLIIMDTRFLEGIAKNSHQSMDLIVDSFKNYQYNVGLVDLSLEDNNILIKVSLDGDNGKRNLSVVLHNFKL